MRGNPGIIFTTAKGDTVVAFHRDQEKQFAVTGRVLVTYLDENYNFITENGKTKRVLKHIDTSQIIGRWD